MSENKPSLRTFLLFCLFASLPVVTITYRTLSRQGTAAESAERLPVLGRVPAFELTERSGKPVSLDELRGEIWVADFIFTRCAGPCPMMTSRMYDLQQALANRNSVRLVSFSVDPQYDTPEVLTAYAEAHDANPKVWWFLTGPKEVVHTLVVKGFKLGGVDNPLLHSTRFVLIDAQGAIRGYYDSEQPDVIQRLDADIRYLRSFRS